MQSPVERRIRRAVDEPHLAVRQLNRWYYRLREGDDRPGVDFFGEEWDNLLLLDACRYDVFADRHDLPGTLSARYSKASATREFLYTYFDGRDLRDTVYVTANPQLYKRRDEVDVAFHEVVHVWRDEGWDESYKTVHPETVANAAVEAAERHPGKRLLVHFMQPHFPFIGETGLRHLDLDHLDFGDGVLNGSVDVDDATLWRAYCENVDVVLPSVDRLLSTLSGRTVVTADHGEMMGERAFPLPMREYGHPAGIRSEELNRVPWLVHDNGPRREVVVGDDATASDGDDATATDVHADDAADHETPDAVVEERLRQLGYR